MLIIHKKRGGDIMIPSTLCHSGSLPDGFTNDSKKMKDL
jgi:hypothetical protein